MRSATITQCPTRNPAARAQTLKHGRRVRRKPSTPRRYGASVLLMISLGMLRFVSVLSYISIDINYSYPDIGYNKNRVSYACNYVFVRGIV